MGMQPPHLQLPEVHQRLVGDGLLRSRVGHCLHKDRVERRLLLRLVQHELVELGLGGDGRVLREQKTGCTAQHARTETQSLQPGDAILGPAHLQLLNIGERLVGDGLLEGCVSRRLLQDGVKGGLLLRLISDKLVKLRLGYGSRDLRIKTGERRHSRAAEGQDGHAIGAMTDVSKYELNVH